METNPTTTPETGESFVIDSREKADWLLKRIAALEAEEALIATQAEKMLAQVRSDRERLTGRFLPQLETWARGELETTKSRRRSVSLFHGTVQFTTTAPRFIVESTDDAITTARAVAPQTVTEETLTKLDKKAFLTYAAQRFEETGEILPGVTRTEAGERFAIRFPKAGAEEAPDQE